MTAAAAAAAAGAGAAARRFRDGLRVLGLAGRLARAPYICRALVTSTLGDGAHTHAVGLPSRRSDGHQGLPHRDGSIAAQLNLRQVGESFILFYDPESGSTGQ